MLVLTSVGAARESISTSLTLRDSVRLRSALKSLAFAALPNTLIVRLQNALSIGAKERR